MNWSRSNSAELAVIARYIYVHVRSLILVGSVLCKYALIRSLDPKKETVIEVQ